MLVLNNASASGGPYWARSAVHSCWLGHGAALLGLSGEVDLADLRAVMLGRDQSGLPLTSRPGLRRRHGWDLVLAAPKSFSLLASMGPEPAAPALYQAYRDSVSDVVEVLEQRAAWMRSGGADVRATGVVAAAYEHLANDSGHPHVHTHMVLANLASGMNGYWGCLVGTELWRWREGLGAAFHLALRSRLAEAGFGFRWEISEGGAGEIVTVPASARSAASSRSRNLRETAYSFGSLSSAARRTAQAKTRAGPKSPTGLAVAGADRAGSGWGEAEARHVRRGALGSPALPSAPPAPGAIAHVLAQRGSAFGEEDVFVALAETLPSGLRLEQASRWAQSWCGTSQLVGSEQPTGAPVSRGRRWTSSLANQLDRRAVDLATEARFAHLAEVGPLIAERELNDLGTPPAVAGVATQLACTGAGVTLLPRGSWLAQAACIDAARAVWQAAGVTVQVASPSDLSGRRWHALTSLRPPGSYPGNRGWGNPGKRVLVVDAADHLSPSALAGLLHQACSNRTKLVLVLGGTVPGRGPTLARSLDELLEQQSAAGLPGADAVREQLHERPAHPPVSVPGVLAQGSMTGIDAMRHMISAWAGTNRVDAQIPLMVAFGPDEADALNWAARSVRRALAGRGEQPRLAPKPGSPGTGSPAIGSPEIDLGGRCYAVGDHVLALRRIGPVRSATQGTVVALGNRSVSVEWRLEAGTWQCEVGDDQALSLGYGYATTVPYLRSSDEGSRKLLVLGDPLELASRSERAAAAWVPVPGPGLPLSGPAALSARYRTAVAELATGWPDREMLERVGPPPPGQIEWRRWADRVSSCALQRALGVDNLGVRGPVRSHGTGMSLSPQLAPSAQVPGL